MAHGALDHAELAAHGLRPDGLLDFSSNLNPFGPPPGVRAALAALDPAPYPDRSCLQLRRELAARYGCDMRQVLPGNGSNELIHLLARALLRPDDVALVVGPTFGEYAHASRLAHARVVEWRACADEHFAIDGPIVVDQIRRLRPRLTWLCAPNNPTGTDMKATDHSAIVEACAANDDLLVVDRTYHAFVRGSAALNDQLMHVASNMLQLQSLTKSYALAGLRLGYLLGDVDTLTRVAVYQSTWSVNSAAQAAGLAALDDADFLPRTLPQLWEASDTLRDGLQQLGLVVWRRRGDTSGAAGARLTLRAAQEAARQQHLPGEVGTDHPQDFVPAVRLQAVEGADDLALRGKAFTEASLIDQTQRDELFVALHEMR